ncbi:hypothetical protein [Acaryochloris marina]|uniref:Uncharacterized protein n=1 Tax=Acaryochloris marina (strain MBIC 11017) TaxID=329726 RepID=A8ZK36_ACAM1|nr:hypothetical protein [Acaryochloris marina]ABW31536.1 hypothetical protein AM1_A0027 [Acaryochloris marina MBIC11017]
MSVIGLTLLFIALGEVSAHAINEDLDPSVGVDLLRESKIRMFETSQWWDALWEDILGDNPRTTVNNKAMFSILLPFLLVACLVLMARAGMSFLSGETHRIVLQQIVPIVLLLAFTLNYGWGAKVVAWSFREVANRGSDLILDSQWAGLVVRDALKDKIHASSAIAEYNRQSASCSRLPAITLRDPAAASSSQGLDQVQAPKVQTAVRCLELLAQKLERDEAAIKKDCPSCETALEVIESRKKGIQADLGRISAAIFNTLNPIDDAIHGFNVVKENAVRTVSIEGPLQIQYWFVSGQELALILSGILAPIMIIYSTLPIAGHKWAVLQYQKALVIIALVRFAYIFVIGFGAIYLTDNPIADQGAAFATFLGYIAPAVATAAVTVGALAASGVYTGAVVTTVGAAVTVVSSAALSASSAVTSRALRNR